jgi:hypothetical protein
MKTVMVLLTDEEVLFTLNEVCTGLESAFEGNVPEPSTLVIEPADHFSMEESEVKMRQTIMIKLAACLSKYPKDAAKEKS